MKMKSFGLSETKLFHFHGMFKKNEIKSAKHPPPPTHTHTFIHMNPLSRNPGSAPGKVEQTKWKRKTSEGVY